MLTSEDPRGTADMATKSTCKVALIRESDGMGHLRERQLGSVNQFLGSRDAATFDIPNRRQADMALELAAEVEAA